MQSQVNKVKVKNSCEIFNFVIKISTIFFGNVKKECIYLKINLKIEDL